MKPPSRKVVFTSIALLSLLVVGVAAAKKPIDEPEPGDADCPPGQHMNPAYVTARVKARLQARVKGLTGAARDAFVTAALLGIPRCVDIDPADPSFDPVDPGTPDAPDSPGHDCPEGYTWDVINHECRPICPPGQRWAPLQKKCVDIVPADDNDVDDITQVVPVPGNFYQVRKGDIFFGGKVNGGDSSNGLSICYMALRRAAYEAATQIGQMDTDEAWAHVNAHASTIKHEIKSLRPYLDVITCSWWNDEAYATWKYVYGKATPGPQGRAIPLNPQNAPNLQLLRSGEAPARNITLGSAGNKPTATKPGSPAIGVNGGWNSYPLLWIPEIDLELYWSSGYATISAEGLRYADGSSRAVPPPWVTIRGITDASGSLSLGTVVGCGPSQRAVT
jgi:hypothetical protein